MTFFHKEVNMTNLELIKNNEYLNDFIVRNGLSDEFVNSHINAFLSVLESRGKCLNCKGLYTCKQLSIGERLDLSFDEILFSEIEYCEFMENKIKEDNLVQSYVYSDIPSNFNNVDINSIELLDDYQKQLCAKLLAILMNKTDKGLYIYGDLGVGKTYECIGLANALVKAGKKVAFVKVSNFINEMRKLVGTDTVLYDSYISKVKEVEYLFLDDIGSESVSSFSRDDILFNVLDYRMENKLCTVFTSNLSKEDLLKHYTFDKKDNSNLMRARRLLERIDILGEDFVLAGSNKRR